jgi:hypothetical protein
MTKDSGVFQSLSSTVGVSLLDHYSFFSYGHKEDGPTFQGVPSVFIQPSMLVIRRSRRDKKVYLHTDVLSLS